LFGAPAASSRRGGLLAGYRHFGAAPARPVWCARLRPALARCCPSAGFRLPRPAAV